ncbi:MAG TPA: NAD-dependent deacylase [Poseidonia sp.]|nr:NAD-dependent deacylase [Poseidonia sp.]
MQRKIVVLTGAGISAESGVRTFRDNGGLWEEHRVEEVATPEAWDFDSNMVWRFYQARRKQLFDVEPNEGHRALAELQNGTEHFTIITQNVDDLHERGGCSDVIHMHGELRSLRCEFSHETEVRMDPRDLEPDFAYCSCCATPSRMRPDIVWFGEMPMEMEKIMEAVEDCDLFIVVGSSGHVYPAAGLVIQAKIAGAHTVLVNLEAPANADAFDEVHLGPAGELLPTLIPKWMKEIN